MNGLVTALIILLLLFALGQIRIGAQVEYCEEGLFIRVRAGAFLIPVFPVKKKARGKTDKKAVPTKPKQKKGGAVKLVLDLLPAILKTAGEFRRKLRVDKLEMRLTVCAADPADAAMRYGQANALLGSLWQPVTRAFHVKDGHAHVGVDFEGTECLIYILSVFPVTRTASAWHPYATNEKISLYNEYLQAMAAEKKVFLIDLAPAVVDEEGVLPEDSGADGIHLNRDYCMRVLEHIYSHTVVLEDPSAPKDENTPEEETAPTGE